jgi:hypothetical protein
VDQLKSKRTMAEQMRLVIFYKVLKARLDAISRFQKSDLAELSALRNPPLVLVDLFMAIAAIFGIPAFTKLGPNKYQSLEHVKKQ